SLYIFLLSFFTDTAPTEIYTLSLHDALPISRYECLAGHFLLEPMQHPGLGDNNELLRIRLPAIPNHPFRRADFIRHHAHGGQARSEEHTSELQSPYDLVCRLLLEKKK